MAYIVDGRAHWFAPAQGGCMSPEWPRSPLPRYQQGRLYSISGQADQCGGRATRRASPVYDRNGVIASPEPIQRQTDGQNSVYGR